jgi:hypothetical protein
MSPTIALKCRMERAMKLEAAARLSRPSIMMPYRTVSIGSEFDTTTRIANPCPTEDEAVFLLLSMSKIVKQEIQDDASLFDSDDDSSKASRNSTMDVSHEEHLNLLTPRIHTRSPTSDDERFTWNRVRTVSIDSPPQVFSGMIAPPPKAGANNMTHLGLPNIVSPMNSPAVRGRPLRKTSLRLCQKKRKQLKLPKITQPTTTVSDAKELKKKALQSSAARGTTLKKILRKKFSWKNYPGT